MVLHKQLNFEVLSWETEPVERPLVSTSGGEASCMLRGLMLHMKKLCNTMVQ